MPGMADSSFLSPSMATQGDHTRRIFEALGSLSSTTGHSNVWRYQVTMSTVISNDCWHNTFGKLMPLNTHLRRIDLVPKNFCWSKTSEYTVQVYFYHECVCIYIYTYVYTRVRWLRIKTRQWHRKIGCPNQQNSKSCCSQHCCSAHPNQNPREQQSDDIGLSDIRQTIKQKQPLGNPMSKGYILHSCVLWGCVDLCISMLIKRVFSFFFLRFGVMP